MTATLLVKRTSVLAAAVAAITCAGTLAADKDAKDAKGPAASQKAPASASAPSPLMKRGKDVNEETMLAFLSMYQSEVYRFVEVVRVKDPKKYDEMKKELINDTRHLLDMKDKRPAMFEVTVEDRKLQFTSLQLSKDLRTPPADARPDDLRARREQLARTVADHFAVRQKLRKLELDEQQQKLAALQKQLEDQRKALDDREKEKASLVNKRVEELLRPKPKIDW